VRVANSVIASAGLVTSGDGAPERAFEAVVTSDVRRLYSLALSILDDAGEAEDAVQKTLLNEIRLTGFDAEAQQIAVDGHGGLLTRSR
jgi:DNA-directed RNA polymerase specialized sigma24 family protein